MRRPLFAFRTLSPGARRMAAVRRKASEAFEMADYAAAEPLYEEVTRARPGDADLLVEYALCATNRGHALDALPRWKAVVASSPDLPLGWCGIAASYRDLKAFASAQDAMREALRRFPEDSVVLSEAARLASSASRHEEALDLWTRTLASGSSHPDWLFHRAETLVSLRRLDEAEDALALLRDAAPDHAGVALLTRTIRQDRTLYHDDVPAPVRRAPPVPGAAPIAPRDLVLRFESLGDNCEFGLVQRYCYAEPLGLFRFSFAHLDKIVDLIERDFAVYGDVDDLVLYQYPGSEEYTCRSSHYKSFIYHTGMRVFEIDAGVLLSRQRKNVKYLIRKLREDLVSAEKILVRKGEPFEDAGPLFRALRSHGPVTLLWVVTADAAHPPGSVERVENGLLCGRVDRFAPYGNANDIDLSTWMDLLRNAVELVDGERLVTAENTPLASGHNWAITERAEAETVAQPRFPGAKTQRLHLLQDTERAFALVAMRLLAPEIEPGQTIAISLWIMIPHDFAGSFVDICFTNGGRGFVGMADLSKRGVWQRIFASTQLSEEQPRAAAAVRVTGHKGDTIYIASWHLETGSIPDRWMDAIPQDTEHTLPEPAHPSASMAAGATD